MADLNKFATTSYTGNGSTVTFALGFSLLDETHLAVTVAAVVQVITTDYTVDLEAGTLTFTAGSIPANLAAIVIKRATAHTGVWVAGLIGTYSDGAGVTAQNLNNSFKQGIYYSEELADRITTLEP